MTAAEFGQERAFETLVKHGATLDAVNKSGKSVLYLAAISNHPNIIVKVILRLRDAISCTNF